MRPEDNFPLSLDEDPFFKEARESFEKVRERMRAETDEFWRKVEADHAKMLRDAENDWKDWERRPKGFNGMAKEEGGGRGEAKHAENSRLDPFQDVFGSSHHSKKMDGMTEDKNKLEVEVNVAEYLPEELRVTVEGGTVRVVGEHNEKDQEGRMVKSLRFDQSFNLPPSATGEEVRGIEVWFYEAERFFAIILRLS